MGATVRESIIICLALIVWHPVTGAEERNRAPSFANMDRAIVFAVEQEIHANHLEKRRDLCLGFGHGLEVDEDGIVGELGHRGLALHTNEWCNQGPRGDVISIVAPVVEQHPGTYEFVVELTDLRPIKKEGEHFGTLLRRGTYLVRVKDASTPELVTYRKTCCPTQSNPTP
jgi:hypothetical protein